MIAFLIQVDMPSIGIFSIISCISLSEDQLLRLYETSDVGVVF